MVWKMIVLTWHITQMITYPQVRKKYKKVYITSNVLNVDCITPQL
jgi:hypothetical protein